MSRSSDPVSELVSEFLGTLDALSSGSYLREDEREFWEPPYPPEVTEEAAEILRRLTTEARQNPTEIPLAVISAYEALTALSDRHGGAVFEDDEEEDFRRLVSALAEENDRDPGEILADLDRITDPDA